MADPRSDLLEELLAEALATFDERGDAGLQAFLQQHPAERMELERGLARCRQMGLCGPTPPARDFPDRLGEFQLVRRLGSGGMGVVYEAEQLSLQRRVALKVVRPELLYFEGARERFRREIEAVARLSHPAIVPVLASGEQDGLPYYAMELLTGLSAAELCSSLQGRDPASLTADDLRRAIRAQPQTGTDPFAGSWWQACTRIVHTIALGVRHAHLRGIVHRDIKPGNIMLTADGRTVLLDFGVALLAGGREFTRTGNNPGSPAFMSPEQLRGDAVDERTDVYSLAATLWQLLTLRAPFTGLDDLQRIRDGDLADVRDHNREVPKELSLVVATAMDRDRDRRYPDVAAFAEDLQAVLLRRPIRARRLGTGLRAYRWCQRHRVAATALSCALLAVLLLPFVIALRERSINRDLATAVAAAERNLDTTLRAIRELLVRVADDRLRHVPTADRMAKEALGEACAMYRQLLPEYPRHDLLRADAARAFTRFSAFLARTGEHEKARSYLRDAIAALGGEAPDAPPDLLMPRAVAHMHFGSQSGAHGDAVGAREHLDAADRDLDLLQPGGAWQDDALRLRAEIAEQRAHTFDAGHDPEQVEASYHRAVEFARQVLQRNPNRAADRKLLVDHLDTLATFLGQRRRYDEARPLLEEALQLAESIPPDARFWPPQPALVAKVLETLGNQMVQEQDRDAFRPLQRCLELREQVAQAAPDDVLLQSAVAAALHHLAYLNYRQRQDERALERLDRAIAIQRSVREAMPTLQQATDYLQKHLVLQARLLAEVGPRERLEAVATELGGFEAATCQRGAARAWLKVAAMDGADVAAAHREAIACLLRAERCGWSGGNLEGDLYAPLRGDAAFEALRVRVRDRGP